MKITIQGQDYTAAFDGERPLTIERKLNAPSVCRLWLSLPANSNLPQPSRNQAVAVVGDDATIYFTGYIAVSPLPEFVGMALEGPRYRMAIEAVSDELLLDQLLMPPSAGATNAVAGALLASLVTHAGTSTLSTQGVSLNAAVNNVVPEPGASWSERAAQVANQARAAYRALSGALTLTSAETTVHPLNETDGSLNLAALSFSATTDRALANDITVCGEHETVAYVTEYFLGDGVTTQFYLTADPFFLPATKSTILNEVFNKPEIDESVWANTGLSGYLSLGAGGLVMDGGNGTDGQVVLAGWMPSRWVGRCCLRPRA